MNWREKTLPGVSQLTGGRSRIRTQGHKGGVAIAGRLPVWGAGMICPVRSANMDSGKRGWRCRRALGLEREGQWCGSSQPPNSGLVAAHASLLWLGFRLSPLILAGLMGVGGQGNSYQSCTSPGPKCLKRSRPKRSPKERWMGEHSWAVGGMGEARPRPEGPGYPKGPDVS